jgi:hypothetical protein
MGVPQGRVLLTEAELDKLRSLRADVTSLLRPTDRPRDVTLLPSASVSVQMGADGAALLEPRGDGSRRVSAIVLIETFTAQRLDNWRRLKLCRNDRCALSFYNARATTVLCTTTLVNAAMPSTSAPRERENDRARSTPVNIRLTPKSLDVQASRPSRPFPYGIGPVSAALTFVAQDGVSHHHAKNFSLTWTLPDLKDVMASAELVAMNYNPAYMREVFERD